MILPLNFTNCRFLFTCAGVTDQMGCSLAFQGDIGATAADIAQIIYDEFEAAFVATSASILVDWTWLGVTATKMTAGGPQLAEVIQPIVGTGAAASMTVNTGYLVRKNTASGGRKNRGRMFVPPFNLAEEEVVSSGHINPVAVADQTGAWGQLLTNAAAANVFPWLLHSHIDDAPTAITSLTTQGQCATQRRRMR